MTGRLAALTVVLALAGGVLAGPTLGAAPQSASSAGALLPGSSGKEPVTIEADRLEFFNKEQKAIYSGNVVATQGETTLRCSRLTIFIDRQASKTGDAPAADAGASAGPGAGSGIRRMEVDGPVTITSKDQVGTGDRGEFDKAANKLYLIGHVVLTQGANVTKGDKLTYDTATGVAVVDSGGASGRVSGFFLPGTQNGASKVGGGRPVRPKATRKPLKTGE